MAEQHWVLLRIKDHGAHPVSHSVEFRLKTYFDNDPRDTSDETAEGFDYSVPLGASYAVANTGTQYIWVPVSKADYDAGNFNFYLAADPPAAAAFRHPDAHGGYLVGRLKLTGDHEASDTRKKGSDYARRTPSVSSEDPVVSFDIEMGNSVAQYMADEFNRNVNDPRLETIRYYNEEAADLHAEDPNNSKPLGPSSTDAQTVHELGDIFQSDADYDFGHLVHADPHPEHGILDTLSQRLQEWFFDGGGEWDHKPRIYPHWGTNNRIDSTGNVYYYDIWSNMHYGFVGASAGFDEQHLNDQAGVAQVLDNQTTEDDSKDQNAVSIGFGLYYTKSTGGSLQPVTFADLHNLVRTKFVSVK